MSSEFQVNTYAAQWQSSPDIARLVDGSFVIVWDSFFFEEVGDVYYVAAQRYSSDGEPIGEETLLSDTSVNARYPRISALEDGGYAVSWEASPGSILNDSDVFTRGFDADGRARGPVARVNAEGDGDVFAAETIATAEGYLVVYTADEDGPSDNELWIRAYDADGAPTGAPIKVNARRDQDDFNARAELLSNGTVIVVWDSEELFPPDQIFARVFAPDGTPLGEAFQITDDSNSANGAFNLTNTNLSVAGLDRDRFVVTYNRIDSIDGDVQRLVLGQIFEGDGTSVGDPFVIDIDDSNEQEHTSVTALPGGGFVVAWDVWSVTDTSGHFRDVYAQVYNAFGQPVGQQITVPTDLVDTQDWPSVVGLSGDRFVVTYQSRAIDGDAEGIAARIFDVPDGASGGVRYTGTQGADTFTGDYGDDVLLGRGGPDQVFGEDGQDRLTGGSGSDRLFGGRGRDTLDGGQGADLMNGGKGSDRLTGGGQDDRLTGGGGDDQMAGGSGRDRLLGGKGDDTLAGGGGDDVVRGDWGQDSLTGGRGADLFLFRNAGETGVGADARDVITDFRSGENDLIDLSPIDARTGGGNQKFTFIGTAVFSHTKGELRIRESGPNLVVLGDRDGDGAADFSIEVLDVVSLSAADFVL